MPESMRLPVLIALLAAACGSTTPETDEPGTGSLAQTRIVFRQYYGNSQVFVVENLAGRDLVALRSRTLRPGEAPVAYVEDEVMGRLLREFRRADFFDHAGPRPADPARLGGTGELTIIDANGRMTSLVRRKGQGAAAANTFVRCSQTLLAVYNVTDHYQATSGDASFGVRRTGYDRD